LQEDAIVDAVQKPKKAFDASISAQIYMCFVSFSLSIHRELTIRKIHH